MSPEPVEVEVDPKDDRGPGPPPPPEKLLRLLQNAANTTEEMFLNDTIVNTNLTEVSEAQQ